jgi:heat shock protein HslJ
MCAHPQGVMAQEAAFLKALDRVATARIEGDRLELRCAEGALIVTATLAEKSSVVPAAGDGAAAANEQPSPLAGEMQYMADAARLRDCKTGRSYPIAQEGDYLAMERAHLKSCREPGAQLYVTFDGSVVQRAKMDGEGAEPTVVVHRFTEVWPNQSCERSMVDASLTNTYWRIVRLGGDTVMPTADQCEPHVLLRREGERNTYAATVGCNSMGGDFTVSGDTIAFSPPASTMMACPPQLDEVEQKLIDALVTAQRWNVEGSTLELRKDTGATVALFEAVYF